MRLPDPQHRYADEAVAVSSCSRSSDGNIIGRTSDVNGIEIRSFYKSSNGTLIDYVQEAWDGTAPDNG